MFLSLNYVMMIHFDLSLHKLSSEEFKEVHKYLHGRRTMSFH